MPQRILLVEDDVMVGPVVREMLTNGAYDVVLTRDLADTVILGDYNFDAVISDFKLLTSDGCDVIEFMRDKKPGIPALLVSGYGQRVADCCGKRGIKGVNFLAKPFSPRQLLDTMAALLAAPDPISPPPQSATPFPR